MKIAIHNNLRLSEIPPDLKKILQDKLSFPNPKWLENHRMGRWNRGTPKILKFFDNVRGGLWIPRGFLRQLIMLCRKQSVAYSLDDRRPVLPPVAVGFSGRLKPFQKKAVAAMLSRDFGTLSAPTGSGKTVMALHMVAERRQPALVVVHTKDLAIQWVDRIGRFLGIAEDAVGFIGAGKHRVGEAITVALVQSLYKCVEEVAPKIGFLLVDECHRCPSRTFTEAVSGFDSRYMLGLSATPWRRDNLSQLIFWHLGDVHHEVEKKQLIRTGDILDVEVIFRKTHFTPYFDPVNAYSKMLSELTADDDRNRLIAADVAREAEENRGVCLVLSDRKMHCENLQALLAYKHGIPCELLTGDVPLAQRQAVLERIGLGECRVLVATGQLIGEGFDCGDLATLFMATPVRFSGRVLQYLGRVLRPAPGKAKARVYDYVDVRVDVLTAAARARQRVYGVADSIVFSGDRS